MRSGQSARLWRLNSSGSMTSTTKTSIERWRRFRTKTERGSIRQRDAYFQRKAGLECKYIKGSETVQQLISLDKITPYQVPEIDTKPLAAASGRQKCAAVCELSHDCHVRQFSTTRVT